DNIASPASRTPRREDFALSENGLERLFSHVGDVGKNSLRAASAVKTIDPRLEDTAILCSVNRPDAVIIERGEPVEIAVGLGRDHHKIFLSMAEVSPGALLALTVESLRHVEHVESLRLDHALSGLLSRDHDLGDKEIAVPFADILSE